MNEQRGLISKIIDWFTHPYYSEGSIMFWTAGLAMILIVAFLWSQVVRQIE